MVGRNLGGPCAKWRDGVRKEELEDDWWIIGNVESRMYLHWKGDGISGCYVQSCSPEDAERFDSKDEAMQEIATSLVQNDLDWGYGEIIPLKVTKAVKVSADL